MAVMSAQAVHANSADRASQLAARFRTVKRIVGIQRDQVIAGAVFSNGRDFADQSILAATRYVDAVLISRVNGVFEAQALDAEVARARNPGMIGRLVLQSHVH